jgi:hypothetical protein
MWEHSAIYAVQDPLPRPPPLTPYHYPHTHIQLVTKINDTPRITKGTFRIFHIKLLTFPYLHQDRTFFWIVRAGYSEWLLTGDRGSFPIRRVCFPWPPRPHRLRGPHTPIQWVEKASFPEIKTAGV